jgi:hypothetical protein
MPIWWALPGVALLLLDAGGAERAVELYALATRYPIVGNSRWFQELAGLQITAAADLLPPEVAVAAQERGQNRDLDATVAKLLVERGASANRR